MKAFFNGVISSFIGFILASFVIIFVLIATLVGLAATVSQEFESKKSYQVIEDRSVLSLRFNYPIHDKTSDDPFDHYDFNTLEPKVALGLDEIVSHINKAKSDNRIKGIYINQAPVTQGWATTESIRNALLDFKDSGKWVLAYNETYTHSSYYLSSVADEVYLNREGYVQFQGLSGQSVFFKDALQRLEIEMQILRGPDNEYKSAVEPFIASEMSDKSREQTSVLVDEVWSHALSNISQSRNIPVEDLNALADKLTISKASDAVQAKLVDRLLYQDEVRQEIAQRMGLEESESINTVSIGEYSMEGSEQTIFFKRPEVSRSQGDQIAVIYAEGNIVSGEGDRGIIGSETMSKAIRHVRENDDVKALVLRVNSPGGSALASDVILREIAITKKVKPVIVSFGNVAASGGYYIAAAADKIYAQPNTITGSIGVFGIFPNMKGFFNNKLGVTFDSVSTNKHSDYGTLSRKMDDFELGKARQQTADVYEVFKAHVATGRNLSLGQVEEIARGRVWTGDAALKIGLIDEFGGLNAAINEAANMAEITHYDLLKLPKEYSPLDKLFGQVEARVHASFLDKELLGYSDYQKEINYFKNAHGVQALMPFSLSIK